MYEREEIKRLQEILMNLWPARHYYFLNGWILRFTDGITSRANSVFPLNYDGDFSTIDKDIDFVYKAYSAYKLHPIFTISDFFEPSSLVIKLLEHGYQQLGCITNSMISSIQELRNEIINEEYTYTIKSERISEFSDFLATYSHRDQNAQRVLQALAERIIIPQKRFVLAKFRKKIIGTLMGILDLNGFLYVVDVFVHPDYRRQKIATSMFFKIINEWGIPNEVNKIWLQVETENEEAMKLYTNLGLKKAYTYYYLQKSL